MAPSWGFQGKCLNNWVKCGSDIRVSLGIPSLCVLRNDVIWDMSLHIFNNREHSNTNTKPLCISKGFLQRWTILTGKITIKTNSPPPSRYCTSPSRLYLETDPEIWVRQQMNAALHHVFGDAEVGGELCFHIWAVKIFNILTLRGRGDFWRQWWWDGWYLTDWLGKRVSPLTSLIW